MLSEKRRTQNHSHSSLPHTFQRLQDAEVVREALLTGGVSRAVAYLRLRHSGRYHPDDGWFAYFKKIGFALTYQAVCQDQVHLFYSLLSSASLPHQKLKLHEQRLNLQGEVCL